MEYNFRELEARRQKEWAEKKIYEVGVDESRPKYYVLDMFPYPSGAGLHVGHPLGYIASDIYTRYKRLCGFNVLHPMGYDAFGLPAEQYAIQTGKHPAETTRQNIDRYRSQMNKIGFSYDPSREICTSDPQYYKWTQWVFTQLFEHWYDSSQQKARPISELHKPENWNSLSPTEQEEYLETYRLAYRADTMVNWCEELGTVLANDEVKDGLSVRGGHLVVQRKMKQWLLRVSSYAERLLDGLDTLDWSESLKDIQKNWIGKSVGAQMFFPIKNNDAQLEIFTTRADTIFGATFMVLAPEHEMVGELTTDEQRENIEAYILKTSMRSERERIAETHRVDGVFTGSYAVNPFNGAEIPIYISDYVLVGYGTGAIMAVPAHDSRDYAFARHFGLDVVPVVEGGNIEVASYDAKEGRMINSDFLNGLDVKNAIGAMLDEVERRGIGRRQVNYRLRDAIFSRQRYWGEPFPVYYNEGIPQMLPLEKLPLKLPEVSDFRPTRDGEPPLARVEGWNNDEGYPYETSTMPGFAGSSAYYLRYMSPTCDTALVDRRADEYWRSVDLYIGGIEHATGHLIYSRFWNKFLYDIGVVVEDEPFRKLVNQGMIQGRSNFVYRIKGTNTFVSLGLKDKYDTQEIHVDINIVRNDVLDLDAFRLWQPEFENAEFVLEDGKYICGWAVEKMSKSMFNVVNPDDIVERYGADTLRMYEMFLGPLRQSKPWDTNGIDGVHKFLRALWRLFFTDEKFTLSDDVPSKAELKTLHKTIRKVSEDIENFSLNTCVSAFMICLNELGKCNKRAIMEPLLVILSPFAPHITDELWHLAGHTAPIFDEPYPTFNPEYLVESEFEYPVSVNGKLRFKLPLPLGLSASEIEAAVRIDERTPNYASAIKKVIVVPGKIINIVV